MNSNSEPTIIKTTPDPIISLYQRRARNYDLTANLYYLLGFREQAYRKKAVRSLHLNPGDTVVELCCGTGLNFSLLHDAVGSKGKIIGVDITDAMLAQAKARMKRKGWANIELVLEDVGTYNPPSGVHGFISTFALTLLPDYDAVIQKTYDSLVPGGRLALVDFKLPDNSLRFLAPLAAFAAKPFGVELELSVRHPWESIRRNFAEMSMEELYGGGAYLAVGKK